MTNVLLLGSPAAGSLGGPSLLSSTCQVLREAIPDASFTLLTMSPRSPEQEDATRRYGVELGHGTPRELAAAFPLLLLWWALRKTGINLPSLLKAPLPQQYRDSDIVIDMRGISFSDFFPGWRGHVLHAMQLLAGVLLGKPVVKFTQDMGPFQERSNRWVARFCLDRLSLVLARGAETRRYLVELGVKRPVLVRPDTAFILQSASDEVVGEIVKRDALEVRPLIGIAPSQQVWSRLKGEGDASADRYVAMLAALADALVEEQGATAVLIPNEVGGGRRYDDLYVARKVREAATHQESIRLLEGVYSAEEIKGVIGRCDMVIASRYHSTIAALSTGVPCLVIGWGHKYREAMGMLGLDAYAFDYAHASTEEVLARTRELWANREELASRIREMAPHIRRSVFSSGKHIRRLLEGTGD